MYNYYQKFVQKQAEQDIEDIREDTADIIKKLEIRLAGIQPHSTILFGINKDIMDAIAKESEFFTKYPDSSTYSAISLGNLLYINRLISCITDLKSTVNVLELENIALKKTMSELDERITKLESGNKRRNKKVKQKEDQKAGQNVLWVKETEDRYRCTVCKKTFKAERFISQHINAKHVN